MVTLMMTLAELSVLQKLRTMLKLRISAVMFVTKFTSATSALSWQINHRVDGTRLRSICRMTWPLIQMMRNVLGKLRPALSGKEINGNRKIVNGDKVTQDRHLQLLFRILVLILLLILGVIFAPSTGYLQDHSRQTFVLGVTNRDTGDVTAPRSSSSRQQYDSDEINDKYFPNFDIFETEQSVCFLI